MTPSPNVTDRLLHTFVQWQTLMMITEVGMRAKPKNFTDEQLQTVTRWQNLPSYILDQTKEIEPWHWIASTDLVDGREFAAYGTLPLELFTWSRYSRRVFHLPHAMQAVFASAAFPDMTWGDLLWPHDSFVVTLDKPLVCVTHEGKEERFDTVMICKARDPDTGELFATLRVFQEPKRTVKRAGLTHNDIVHFKNLVRKRQFKKALSAAERHSKRAMKSYYDFMPGAACISFNLDKISGNPLLIEPEDLHYQQNRSDPELATQVAAMGNEEWASMLFASTKPWEETPPDTRYHFEIMSAALRIVLSWMLYLESAPTCTQVSDSSPVNNKLPSGHLNGAGIITSPQHIFNVVGKGFMNFVSDGEVRSRSGAGFIRPHWRRAHMRRPKGSALDAPKTERVPATLVRSDLVPLYGLVGGTTSVVIASN